MIFLFFAFMENSLLAYQNEERNDLFKASFVLDIVSIFLYAIFKVHKDAITWKTIVRDKLACLSMVAFSCIGM